MRNNCILVAHRIPRKSVHPRLWLPHNWNTVLRARVYARIVFGIVAFPDTFVGVGVSLFPYQLV